MFNGCLLPFFSICLLLCINDEQFMGRWESQTSSPRSPCQHCHLFQVPSEGLAQHLPCDRRHDHPPARQQRYRAEGEKDLPKTKHGETLNSNWRKTSKVQTSGCRCCPTCWSWCGTGSCWRSAWRSPPSSHSPCQPLWEPAYLSENHSFIGIFESHQMS